MKREEQRIAQDRLKMIDKRTRYSEFIKEILSPSSKAKLSTEPVILSRGYSKQELYSGKDDKERFLPKSSSKRESMIGSDKDSVRAEEITKKTDPESRRFKPRSYSKKESSPYKNLQRIHGSPFTRKTSTPVREKIS